MLRKILVCWVVVISGAFYSLHASEFKIKYDLKELPSNGKAFIQYDPSNDNVRAKKFSSEEKFRENLKKEGKILDVEFCFNPPAEWVEKIFSDHPYIHSATFSLSRYSNEKLLLAFHVLGKFPNIEKLNIHADFLSLSSLPVLQNLKFLRIWGVKELEHPKFLERLPNLKKLWTNHFWSGIKALKNLEEVDCCTSDRQEDGQSEYFLENHPSLKKVKILKLESDPIVSLSIFSTISNLRELELTSRPKKPVDVHVLKRLKFLEKLKIQADFYDLKPLSEFSALKVLELSRAKIYYQKSGLEYRRELTKDDLEPILKITGLCSLNLEGSLDKMENLDVFLTLKNLQILNLKDNFINPTAWEDLEKFPDLHVLKANKPTKGGWNGDVDLDHPLFSSVLEMKSLAYLCFCCSSRDLMFLKEYFKNTSKENLIVGTYVESWEKNFLTKLVGKGNF